MLLGHNVENFLKTLKQEGVPFGARMVFRLQHAGFLLATLGLVLTIPFAALWSLIHPSGQNFIEGVGDVLQARLARVKAQRERLVHLYAGLGA